MSDDQIRAEKWRLGCRKLWKSALHELRIGLKLELEPPTDRRAPTFSNVEQKSITNRKRDCDERAPKLTP